MILLNNLIVLATRSQALAMGVRRIHSGSFMEELVIDLWVSDSFRSISSTVRNGVESLKLEEDPGDIGGEDRGLGATELNKFGV